MDYPYTIKDLATKAGKTEQSLQKFIKKNNEFINEHTLQTGRFKRYSQEVMDLVIKYYQPQEESPAPSEQVQSADSATDEASERIAALEAEIQELKTKLEESENERKEMIRQNASLLLLLQEEKQEKMLLLPAPKQSFPEKIKSFFRRPAKASDKKAEAEQ